MPSARPPPADSEQLRPTPPDGSASATGSPTVAVAHYPEGAGHATRMLAIADALEARGAEVLMAGGGAGSQFVALNGYDAFEPTCVDFIDTVQEGTVRQVLTGSLPASAGRIADYIDWLRSTAPDALVTDDMFAAMAALRVDVPLYVLKHDMPGLYRNRLERAGAAFHTDLQVAAAREFFYPTVWPDAGLAPADATRVPPVALEGSGREREAADVVVVPSHYSELGRIADALEREGHDVIDVGGDDWEPVPSLLPYLRDAEVVVCSGYSTVMDAAVAGTPCVVHPATDEQEAVADRLRGEAATGFAVAEGPLDVLEAVADPPAPPAHENGAARVAATVLDDLGGATAAAGDVGPTGEVESGTGTGSTRAGQQVSTPDRLPSGARRGPWSVRRAVRASVDGARRVVGTTGRTAVTAATAARSVARSTRRYALAIGVFLASIAVFTGWHLRRTGDATTRVVGTLASALGSTARRVWTALATGRRVLERAAVVVASGAARSGRALRDAVADTSRR
ncbi:hypothetical protein [Haloglomus litoreum]|uniref:hypothetical protein n=1 Tax=Haloglomus litoreum TaxID=3034026 RepID=UPI0023E85252|nr:hypothetical protein [Haloglomus sp. DT116]